VYAALSGNGTAIEAEYSYYPGLDKPHAVVKNGTAYYAHTDGLGNVVALTDQNKTVQRTYQYDAWGRLLGGSDNGGLAGRDRARFKGALWMGDAALEVYYMRNRWYEPKSGRFLSEDPIGLNGGINQYAYALQDPINARDPSGLNPCGRDQPGGLGPHVHTEKDSTGQVIVVEEHIDCASEEDQQRILDWLARLAALGTLVWHDSRTTTYSGVAVDLVPGLGVSFAVGWWADGRGNFGIYVSGAALVGADVSVQMEYGKASSWRSMFGLAATGEVGGAVGASVWSNGRQSGAGLVGGWSLTPVSGSAGGSITLPIRFIRGR
jgi:RHS repeat-associated protein